MELNIKSNQEWDGQKDRPKAYIPTPLSWWGHKNQEGKIF